MMLQGKDHEQSDGLRAGDIGAVAKLKDVQSGDMLLDAERTSSALLDFPEPVMSFAVTPKTKGDEDKVASRCGACARRTRRCTSAATRRPAADPLRA